MTDSTLHMIIGSATLLLFLLNALLYAMQLAKGTAVGFHRLVSIAAATGLLIQYALGFMLLGGEAKISWTHWVIALVAMVPVGIEHGMTANEENPRRKASIGLFASILAFVLVLTAYGIAEMR